MKIWMNSTPSWVGKFYSEALPLGNGKTSAMLAGNVGTERLWVNYYTLWEGKKEDELPDVTREFAEMREKIENREFNGNTEMLAEALRKKGFDSYLEELGAPVKPIEIKMNFEAKDSFKKYQRGIETSTGEAFVKYISENEEFKRNAFVSFADDCVVFKAQSKAKFDLNLFIPEGLKYDLKISENGLFNKTEKCIVIKNINELLLKLSFNEIPNGTYEELFEKHLVEFKKAMGETSLTFGENNDICNEHLIEEATQNEIPIELCEKLWNYGRYLFISGTNENAYPFPLYGLWAGKSNALFAQHVANENVQSIYWHTAVGGLFKNTKALIHYYYNMIPKCKEAAKKIFNCRGIYVSAYTSPINSLPAPNCGVIINYVSTAAWLCRHFYEYYKFSNDEELFEKEILPFMVLTAEFFEDYIIYDKNGNVVISPSVSPENTPDNLLPEEVLNDRTIEGHFNVAVRNSTMDFAILKDLLTSLIEISKEKNILSDKVLIWNNILSKIPPYRVNKDGAIAEWMDEGLEDNYYHRHLSHIYPLFPGNEITTESELFDAFKKAIDLRKISSSCGWSFPHMSAIYARVQNGEKALKCIENLTKYTMIKNFFTTGTDWRDNGGTSSGVDGAFVQLDAIMGAVNAFQEMLFNVNNNKITFLPACPEKLYKGEAKKWYFPGGTVDFSWNREQNHFYAKLFATKDITLEITFPKWTNKEKITLNIKKNDKIEL